MSPSAPRGAGLAVLLCSAACGPDAALPSDEVGLTALERLGKRLFDDPATA